MQLGLGPSVTAVLSYLIRTVTDVRRVSQTSKQRNEIMANRMASMLAIALVVGTSAPCWPQQEKGLAAKATTSGDQANAKAKAALFEAFTKKLSGAALVGHFTIDGKSEKSEERYTINKVTKMPKGDYWLFEARITYGNKDVTIPMPLEVKWAANTPVITLDNVKIPTLGTFDARVLIDGDRYAGTWQHDAVGGLMFGRIEPASGVEPKEDE